MNDTETPLAKIQEDHDRATLQLATVQAQRELTTLSNQTVFDAQESFGNLVPWTDYPQFDMPGFAGHGMAFARDANRREGKYPPFFETEVELENIRWFARWLRGEITIMSGVLGRLSDYVIGSGFEYTVQFRKNVNEVNGLVEAVQFVVDEFHERTKWLTFQGEVHDASREDGEAFIHLEREGWQTDVSMFQPEWVTEPSSPRELEEWVQGTYGIQFDSFVPSWTFGILTPEHKTHKTLGYHVVRDVVGNDFDFLPVSEVVHVRRNVPYDVKRGMTDFYPNRKMAEKTHKLAHKTVSGATAQAAIAFIREHAPGTTGPAASSMISSNRFSSNQVNTPNGSATINTELMGDVQSRDIPNGMTYHAGPMGQSNAPIFVDVVQLGLRMVGMRWAFPEYMISADASNANFSSTMVAESPFVKARETDQRFYADVDRDVLRRVVSNAHDGGYFERFKVTKEDLWALIEINIEGPEVASRNKLELAQTQSILIAGGVMSKRTAATQQDLDYDQELANIEEEPKAPQPPQPGQSPGELLPEVPSSEVPQVTESEQIKEDCGTSDGGFKGSNTCSKGGGGTGKGSRGGKGRSGEGKPADKKTAAQPGTFNDRKKVRKHDKKSEPELNKRTANLSGESVASVEKYTSGETDYRTMNESLRSGKTMSSADKAEFDSLQLAIGEAGDLPAGTTVYRGLSVSDSEKVSMMESFKKGGEIEMSGITSTSLDPDVAGGFATRGQSGVVFEMKPKSGAYVSQHSGFDRSARKHGGQPENEVLLQHGKKYRVVAVQDDVSLGSKQRKGFGVTVVQLEEI